MPAQKVSPRPVRMATRRSSSSVELHPGVVEPAQHLGVDGVLLLGAVDGDDEDVAVRGGVAAVAMDVADKRSVDAGFAAVAARCGGLDGLVTCAGLTFAYRIEALPEERLRHIVDVNLIGTVLCCQAAIPYLRARGGGRIVTVSSASARHRDEFPHMAIYGAVKAAVEKFSLELRDEVKRDGIGVTCISPGSFVTDITANFDPDHTAAAYDRWVRDHGPESDGMADPRWFGEAVAHCLSYPRGVAVDFMEVRPNVPTPKR
jgi:NAD(P)-dependent dehydrogenase (short-subunit alcohol dehydrogenase family)